MLKMIIDVLRKLFPFIFTSTLRPLTFSEQLAYATHYKPLHRFQFFGRSNGRSHRRKTNRLHLSTKTRNKHR
jgi:hypothetical protein